MSGGIDDDAFYTQMLTESYPRVVAGSGSAARSPPPRPMADRPRRARRARVHEQPGVRRASRASRAPERARSFLCPFHARHARLQPPTRCVNFVGRFRPATSLVELSKHCSPGVGGTTIAVPALASRLQKRAAALGEALPFMTARRYAETASAGGADTEAVADVAWLHQELSRRFGRDPEAKRPRAIVDRVKKNIMAVCGGEGLKGLKRELAAMVAHDDHGQLSKYELAAGLEDKGISLNNRELGEVFRHFDADHSGAHAEFITGDGARVGFAVRRLT